MPNTLTKWLGTLPNNDTFDFSLDIAGNTGRATIYIHGYFVTAL